ncbi:hypothetical protein C7402_102297 [Paraburkholderia unamae]|uniref:Post-SET domain-containing protein n=2 Tax=Paraburkholderia unamae TaxID=219649 RepID=A0ABX5KVD2_9BURK|nr:hypothetical protein C7402_102297 [Paraburkholderia unamae]
MEAIHEGIFKSAEEAVTFACNYSGQQYAMSAMAKILKGGPCGSGRGLFGIDGAGQAGMVFAELDRLDYWQAVALVARRSPQNEECKCSNPCCRGWKMPTLFSEAMHELADEAARAMKSVPPKREFRVAVLMKYFGVKVHVLDRAESLRIPEDAAKRHATAIRNWIREIEKAGLTALSERLDAIGMLVRTA